MTWEEVRGQLKQVSGQLKAKWGKLTDDDMLLLEGQRDTFVGRVQERTGLAREEAERQLDELLRGINAPPARP